MSCDPMVLQPPPGELPEEVAKKVNIIVINSMCDHAYSLLQLQDVATMLTAERKKVNGLCMDSVT